MIGTTAQTIGHVRWMMEHGKFPDTFEGNRLSNKQLLVLLEYAANANDKLHAWVPQEILAKRTGISIRSIYRVLHSLGDYLKIVGYRTKGIPIYELTLPGLTSLSSGETKASPAEATEVFDVMTYVAGLKVITSGVEPSLAQAVAKWHWVTSTNTYWRERVKTEKDFWKSFPSMRKQYEADSTKSSGKPKYKAPTLGAEWVPEEKQPWE